MGRDVAGVLLDALSGELAAPHMLDLEVLSVLRRLVLGRELSERAASAALEVYFSLVIHRYEAAPLAARIWDLRHQDTSYDAAYIALAEALDAPLHTCDAKLDSEGHRAVLQVHGRTQ